MIMGDFLQALERVVAMHVNQIALLGPNQPTSLAVNQLDVYDG